MLSLFALVAARGALFTENFDGGMDSWVQSKSKSDLGKFELEDGAIKTSQDAKFYGLGTSFDKFSNEGKTLIVSFSVKHGQTIDCGGGYVKLFPSTLDLEKMEGDSVDNIMFGPDLCGYSTKKVHVIFRAPNKDNANLESSATITAETDDATHLYSLVVEKDNSYKVFVDGAEKHSGSLKDDFDFLEAKEIKDPEVSKPSDWVDETMIDDPEDKKPEDWVEEKEIVDPEAEKPEDWDDEMDGEWEAPTIDNPDYKGEWSAKRIDNPDYKGEWVHPMIANPKFVDDDTMYAFEDFGAIGIDVWQVKSGSTFDNFLITDDQAELDAQFEAFKGIQEAEK
jgi:calreticulin